MAGDDCTHSLTHSLTLTHTRTRTHSLTHSHNQVDSLQEKYDLFQRNFSTYLGSRLYKILRSFNLRMTHQVMVVMVVVVMVIVWWWWWWW